MGTGRAEVLKTLHAAATEIQACDTVERACERTVAAAEDVLEFDICSIILHDGDGRLVPAAMSSDAPADGIRRVRDDQGLAGKTYQNGESYHVDEIEPDDETDPAKSFYRSGMSVPIGDVGVFQAVSGEPGAFDDADVELVELLVAHTARTIDRIQFRERLQARGERLQRQNERLEQFVSVVSHDLRNPLTVAAGELDLARADCDSDHLDAVAREHQRMETLIDDLLALAREGRPVEETEAVALGALTTRCWQHVRTTDATLEVDADVELRADPGRLQQLLENLFRNAVDHGGPDVTITVGTLDDGFYVADDGPGIPEAERGRVFERGFSTMDEGTGFGLAIVEEIVDAHDWAVGVVDGDDGGARFEVTGVEFA